MADEETYEDMTVEQLQEELRARDLPVSGNKDELIERLEADDEGVDPDAGAADPEDDTRSGPDGVDTVTVEDSQGNELEAEIGMDGESPVSAENPPTKAVIREAP